MTVKIITVLVLGVVPPSCHGECLKSESTIRRFGSTSPSKNEKAQYASLSYCWGGGGKQIMTTNSTLHDHLLALPRHFPKTISDAIEVCRKVGIRYLWIDAFCIIQDNSCDKLDHIASMGSIYKSSTVTIVAASAERVTDGFLADEEPSDQDPREPIAQLPIFIDNSTCERYISEGMIRTACIPPTNRSAKGLGPCRSFSCHPVPSFSTHLRSPSSV